MATTDKNACESCEQLRIENEALREEINALKNVGWRPKRQWIVAVAGWLALTILPVATAFLVEMGLDNWVGFAAYGWAFVASWAQWSILTCLIVLLADALWKRTLLLIVTATGLVVCWTLVDNWVDGEVAAMVYTAPIAGGLIALPLLTCRVLLRWQIFHQSDTRQPTPASIAGYFILTLIVGILVTYWARLPDDSVTDWALGGYVSIFATPIVAIAMVTVPLTRTFLVERSIGRVGVWLTLLACTTLSCVASSVSPTLFAISNLPSESPYYYATFGASWSIAFVFWFVFALLLARCLGYRIRP